MQEDRFARARIDFQTADLSDIRAQLQANAWPLQALVKHAPRWMLALAWIGPMRAVAGIVRRETKAWRRPAWPLQARLDGRSRQ